MPPPPPSPPPPRSSSSPSPAPQPPHPRQLRRVTAENRPLLKAAASSASLRSRDGNAAAAAAPNIVDSVAAFGNNVRVVVRVRAFLPRGTACPPPPARAPR